MHIIPVRTRLLERGDDLATLLRSCASFEQGDILVISSKALSVVEGSTVELSSMSPSPTARTLARERSMDPQLVELILHETTRMNGRVTGTSPHVILTSIKPNGMEAGRILCPNAGIDLSNVRAGMAVLWPKNPVQSATELHRCLGIPVIVSDSCCHPGRIGVTAFALATAGMMPTRSEQGTKDLFGKPLKITVEATADQLATAANAVMGNAAQSCPAAIVRGCAYTRANTAEWVSGIEPEHDLFRGME